MVIPVHVTGFPVGGNAHQFTHVYTAYHPVGALAEFERDIIRERTNAGLQAARARGRLGGRPRAKTLDTPKKVTLAQSLYDDKNNTIEEICKTLNISRPTLYRYIRVGQKAA